MAIYVDAAIHPYRGQKWCHMIADTLDELHDMAEQLDLKRSWFQDKRVPHYDLAPSKRILAIQFGAKEVDRDQYVAIMVKYGWSKLKIWSPEEVESIIATIG